jgi:hypothetical protein
MGFAEWQQLADLIRSPRATRALNLPGNVRVRREGDTLFCEREALGPWL